MVLYDQQVKQVFQFFNDIAEESNIVLLRGDGEGDRISLRIQMVISFSLMEVLASYWYEYLGKTAKTSERSCDWYDVFCKTNKNKEYTKEPQWNLLSSKRLYHFRNSLVHFMGMSEVYEGTYMGLVPNDLPDEEKENLQRILKKDTHSTIVVRPHDFHRLIRQGGILMLNKIQETIKQAETDKKKKLEYLGGIDRIWKKFIKEGAVKIYKPKR